MKLTFITNSCMLIELKSGTTILCDPWLRDGIYDGAWGNYPELKERDRWLELKPDYIYISHIHPDHCDLDTLISYDKGVEILIGDMKNRHLYNKMTTLFASVIQVPFDSSYLLYSGESIVIHPSFIPTGQGQADLVDYEIDTALSVIDSDGTTLFNCNDNPIRPESALKLLDDFYPERPPDIALLPCSGAGLYPQCMADYGHGRKMKVRNETQAASALNFNRTMEVFQSPITVPLSGQYKLIGRHEYLDKHIRRVDAFWFDGELITWLNEGDTVEIDGPVDMQDMMNKAFRNVGIKSKTLQLDKCYFIKVNGEPTIFGRSSHPRYGIEFTLDPYMLIKIMQGRISWNEAEIGSHIMVSREPDIYDKTIHSLMNYYRI